MDRSAPATPARGESAGSPGNLRYREMVSPTLRGEEPPSINIPRPVRLPHRIATLSAGSRHTLALTTDGQVYSWGWGAQGQLGLGHTNSVVLPTKVESLPPIASISAGGIHSACLDHDGQCYIWGSGEYGQLGLGSDSSILTKPQPLVGEDPATPLRFSKIACGGMHTAGIDMDGNLWCWGRADSGQTGSGKWVFSYFPGLVYPKRVSNISDVRDVCCGGFHTVVLTASGRALAMGKEDFGVLGTGISHSKKMKQGTETLTEVAALADETIVGISCGGWHTLFWTDKGMLYACGKGEYGRLGLGSELNVPAPTLVTFEDPSVRVVSASCGGSHSLILSSDGRVFSVGRSDDGRLGIGPATKPKIMKPLLVAPNQPDLIPGVGGVVDASSGHKKLNVLQIVAGGAHSLILVENKGSSRDSPIAFSLP